MQRQLQEQIEYWVNKLSGFESLNLQSDLYQPKTLEYHGKRKYFTLDKASAQPQALSKEHGTTLHTPLSIFSIPLSKYTDRVTSLPAKSDCQSPS
ncbi:hypothetical protein KCP76_26450 (plasmid) [Salmonella enterica subsp. enterica serovar Weltevreden]|nr:hypothetical protein KCP76_26450 [Salmonella enterica subsp. enterica serovar Weltevreden]